MTDTQKTTKAVREAPAKAENTLILLSKEEIRLCLGYDVPRATLSDVNRKFRDALERIERND